MPDLSVLIVPLLGAAGVFVVALLSSDNIAIENIRVPQSLEESGYSSIVVTRMLIDDMHQINDEAVKEDVGLVFDSNFIDKSFSSFEDFFALNGIVDATRNLTVGIPFSVNGEVTGSDKEMLFRARIYDRDDPDPMTEIEVTGDPDHVPEMVRQAATEVMLGIAPFVVALKAYGDDLEKQRWDFAQTRELLRKHIENPPPEDNYLAYELIARMHRVRAQEDRSLSAPERQAELDKAMEYLQAAYVQNPGYYYTNLNLARVYALRGDPAMADRYFAGAVKANPDDGLARKIWAAELAQQGRFRDAVNQYVAAVELEPDDAALHSELAAAYLKLDRPDYARQQWKQAQYLDPLNRTYAASLAALPPDNP
ncbi:MAG: tetratricopeptide repeat protein [Dongiaceae bacterium]